MKQKSAYLAKVSFLVVGSCGLLLANVSPSGAETSEQRAWDVLHAGITNEHAGKRATAVRVLGLLQGDPRAAAAAENALSDDKAEVRAAAAYALGNMGDKQSIPKLRAALQDKETEVVLAAAKALLSLGDTAGYEVYYAILTGERKTGKGLLAGQEKMLRDPKKLAEFGFEQGIGFIPFAGLGWEALKTLARDDVSPVRAAAAESLADDRDPASGQALADASGDKSWIVRAAALDAIARRGDPSLLPQIVHALTDDKDEVRYTAAAVVLKLTAISKTSHQPEKK